MSDLCSLSVITGKTFVASFQRLNSLEEAIPFLETDVPHTILYDSDGTTPLRTIPTTITNMLEGNWQIRLEDEDTAELPHNCTIGSYTSRNFYSYVTTVADGDVPLISNGVLLIYPGLI